MLRFAIWFALLAFAVVFALSRGGRPEKQTVAILVAMLLLDRAYHAVAGPSLYLGMDEFHAFNDIWALAAMVTVALTANRFWPLWVASAQVIAVSAHFVRAEDLGLQPIIYAAMTSAPSWLQIVVLMMGTWNFRRRHRKAGFATSQTSSPG